MKLARCIRLGLVCGHDSERGPAWSSGVLVHDRGIHVERSADWSRVLAAGVRLVVDVIHGSAFFGVADARSGQWTRVLIPMGVPLIIVALAWVALHRKRSRGGRVAGYVAGALVGMLVAGCLVAIASVGLLIAPVAALLARAAAITPSGSSHSGALTGAIG